MFYTALSRVTSHIQNLCENQPEGTFKGGFFPPMFFVKKLVPQVTTEEYIYLVDIPVGILVFGIVWPQKGEGKNKKKHLSSVQNPGWLFDIRDEILPNYMGIIS